MCKQCAPARTCECGHSSVIHNKKGACNGLNCLCGWTRDMGGALHYKSTGEPAFRTEGWRGFSVDAPGRKKNRGVRISRSERRNLMAIPCYFCGGKAESLDHLTARARGGSSDRGNLVSACFLCNGMKGDKSYDEFMDFCRSMETAVLQKTALRHVARFLEWKDQAKRVLVWHEKRIKARQLPVV